MSRTTLSNPGLTRRGLLAKAASAAVAGGIVAGALDDLPRAHAGPAPAVPAVPRKMPVVFVGHGSPMTALNATRGGEWQTWAKTWEKPKAILVVSAHWEAAPATLGATRTVPLIYDFSGFPRSLYAVTYAAPGAPLLAQRVRALLKSTGGVKDDPKRGLDHGAWVPLVWVSREADVPVLQLSLPAQDGPSLVALGRALAPLRDEGVLIVASGNLTHNLRAIDRRANPPTPAWASDHDTWLADVLTRRDLDALTDFRRRAPALQQNHPTLEHLTPLLVAAGAAAPAWTGTKFPVTGWDAGSLSRRCVELS